MATSLHRIYQNFQWRMETITPTNTATSAKAYFRRYDPLKSDPPDSSGGWRKFFVKISGGDEDLGASDAQARESWMAAAIFVAYPARAGYDDMNRLVQQDRHDILKQMRTGADIIAAAQTRENRLGYDADNTTTNIGLIHREPSGWNLDDAEAVWFLELRFKIYVRELEI